MQHRRWIALVLTVAGSAHAAPLASIDVARPPPIEPIEPKTPPPKVEPRRPVVPYTAIHVGEFVDPRITVERAGVTFRDVGAFQVVTMAIAMTSAAEVWHEANLAILVPHDARILGMTYGQNGQVHRARMMFTTDARQDYAESTHMMVDPALLDQVAWTEQFDRMQLSVYPLSADQHASVEIVVAVPRAEQLDVDLGVQHFEHRAGTPARPTAAEVALLRGEAVTTNRALYVEPAEDTVTPAEIRNAMLASRTAMFPCNFFRDEPPETDTHVVAHFTIGTDGKVTAGAIDGAGEQMAKCIADALGTWQMRRGKQPVPVSYPLHFGWGRR